MLFSYFSPLSRLSRLDLRLYSPLARPGTSAVVSFTERQTGVFGPDGLCLTDVLAELVPVAQLAHLRAVRQTPTAFANAVHAAILSSNKGFGVRELPGSSS